VSRAERWMAGKRHFIPWRENAHCCTRSLRRQNKRRFGEVELQGKRLHLGSIKRRSILEHAQGIASERRVALRKDIHYSISVAGHLR